MEIHGRFFYPFSKDEKETPQVGVIHCPLRTRNDEYNRRSIHAAEEAVKFF